MLTIALSVLCAVAALAPAPALDEQTEFAIGDRGFAVVRAVDAAEREGYSGVVLAAVDGEVVAVVATGAGDEAIRPDTLFEIASATKQFTAAAVMTLVQEGKLSLDDPISEHLPGVPEHSRGITVRHLLQHTSGIPGSNSRGGGHDIAAVLPTFLGDGPKHEPGADWEYWNQGYALLSEVIARASGQPYTSYLREALFTPAAMTSTMFTGDEPPASAVVATGRSRMGAARAALEHPYGNSYGLQYRGMGGVVTNVWDLWRWHRALGDEHILRERSKVELFRPGLRGYALGWFVRDGVHGAVQSHGGAVRGFTCELRRYPDRDAMIVVLCNTDAYAARSLADDVERSLLAQPNDVSNAATDRLRRLIGRYTAARGIELEISDAGEPGRLRAIIRWGGRFANTRAIIEPEGDGLVMDDGSGRHTVREEAVDGVVERLTIAVGEDTEMVFRRVRDGAAP
jgi:CubicO group peptidase (beta-lactamase class C family)